MLLIFQMLQLEFFFLIFKKKQNIVMCMYVDFKRLMKFLLKFSFGCFTFYRHHIDLFQFLIIISNYHYFHFLLNEYLNSSVNWIKSLF